MWNNSLKTDIIADEILDILLTEETDKKSLISKLKEQFCELSDEKIDELVMIISRLVQKNKGDLVEIVSTAPISFNTRNRKIFPVLKETILSAQRSIIITGYSISDHFNELMSLINLKSKQGVKVELFLNDYEAMKHLFADIDLKNKSFFKIYTYSGITGDEMSSLHAKTVVVDDFKVIISSANLSYHGMVSNIEIGVLIESKTKALQVLDIFNELKRTKKFVQVN